MTQKFGCKERKVIQRLEGCQSGLRSITNNFKIMLPQIKMKWVPSSDNEHCKQTDRAFNQSLLYKRYIFNFHYLPMSTVSAQKAKLVTNFIIIPAPAPLPLLENMPSPTTKREESPHSEEQHLPPRVPGNPTTTFVTNRKRYPKDDYQKNITINVVKCCIREILSSRYKNLLRRQCVRGGTTLEALTQMVSPVLKEVVISLGDLKKLLTSADEEKDLKLKRVFAWFLEWYLRKRYMNYLLNEGKMDHKERYIDYKNKYMLYLLQTREILIPYHKKGSQHEHLKQEPAQ